MTIYDLADTLDVVMLWQRMPNTKDDHVFWLEHCFLLDKGVSTTIQGRGRTPYEAIADFVEVAKGKRLVQDGHDDKFGKFHARREFMVPATIEK